MMPGSPGRFPDTGLKRLEELSRFTLDVFVSLSNRAHAQLCSYCVWSRAISEGSSSG